MMLSPLRQRLQALMERPFSDHGRRARQEHDRFWKGFAPVRDYLKPTPLEAYINGHP